jgi:MFS family permease
VGFSFCLSLSAVALPLLALAEGYSAGAVGLLTALSAVSQLLVRLGVTRLLRRYPDRLLVGGSALLLGASTAIVAVSTAPAFFVACQVVQGAARAAFWTASQTHVVRGTGPSLAALSRLNLASAAGLLMGPLAAGVLVEWSFPVTLMTATALGLIAAAPTLLFDHLPPFPRYVEERGSPRLWRRPGVDAGCWAGATAGGWRGLLHSYVPVALEAARQPSATIGALVSVANACSLAGAALAGRLRPRDSGRAFALGVLGCGAATAPVALVAGSPVAVAALLAVSGVAAGVLQTLGPAMADGAVAPGQRGDAIAVAGTFRAAALFASPLAVAGLLAVVTVGPALAVTGALMTLPAVLLRSSWRGRTPRQDDV